MSDQLVEFPARRAIGANGPVDVARDVRIYRTYPPQAIEYAHMHFLSCACPRFVARDKTIGVWHSPECPELEHG